MSDWFNVNEKNIYDILDNFKEYTFFTDSSGVFSLETSQIRNSVPITLNSKRIEIYSFKELETFMNNLLKKDHDYNFYNYHGEKINKESIAFACELKCKYNSKSLYKTCYLGKIKDDLLAFFKDVKVKKGKPNFDLIYETVEKHELKINEDYYHFDSDCEQYRPCNLTSFNLEKNEFVTKQLITYFQLKNLYYHPLKHQHSLLQFEDSYNDKLHLYAIKNEPNILNLSWKKLENAAKYVVSLYRYNGDANETHLYHLDDIEVVRSKGYLNLTDFIYRNLIVVVSAYDREDNLLAKTKGMRF